MRWKSRLKKVCSQIPVNMSVAEVQSYVSKFLKLRTQETFCRFCGQSFYANSSMQLLYPECPKCSSKRKERQLKINIQKQEEDYKSQIYWEKKRIKDMNNSTGSPYSDYTTMLEYITNEDIKQLKRMKHKDFLNTIYWKNIRKYVLYKRRYKCELCYSNKNLHVHHKTYICHGHEHEYDNLSQLIVLCENCHKKHHLIGEQK